MDLFSVMMAETHFLTYAFPFLVWAQRFTRRGLGDVCAAVFLKPRERGRDRGLDDTTTPGFPNRLN